MFIIVLKEPKVQTFYSLFQMGTVLLDTIFALYAGVTRFILSHQHWDC